MFFEKTEEMEAWIRFAASAPIHLIHNSVQNTIGDLAYNVAQYADQLLDEFRRRNDGRK